MSLSILQSKKEGFAKAGNLAAFAYRTVADSRKLRCTTTWVWKTNGGTDILGHSSYYGLTVLRHRSGNCFFDIVIVYIKDGI